MNNTFFSFILPAYKAEFLEESIQSILSQTYTNFELVIVDDDSPFNLKSIVDKFQDKRITYYKNEENIGGKDLVKQWNHCIEYAKGDYIVLAADDDIYDKDFLLEINQLMGKYPSLNVYRGRNQNIDENGEITNQELRVPELLTFDEFLIYEVRLIRCIGNLVFYSKKLKENKFPEYPLAWWTDIAVVIQLINDKIATTQKIVYSFRMSNIHISHKKDRRTSLMKVNATFQYFNYLSKLLYNYNNSTEFIKKNIYNQYLKDDFLMIQSIRKILNQLSLSSLIWIFSKIKNQLTIKQKNKLILYYIANKLKRLIHK